MQLANSVIRTGCLPGARYLAHVIRPDIELKALDRGLPVSERNLKKTEIGPEELRPEISSGTASTEARYASLS